MGGILWLYQTQGLFIICAPDTDVTENSLSDCLWTDGLKKTWVLIFFIVYFLTKYLNWLQVFLYYLYDLYLLPYFETLFPLKLVIF